ncbi:hypothetical protein [Shewanella atlantica]|uniref:hypothetical protein n=1 Tax=Shewanella atlantica TaxID=271099 RepID=UPI003735CF3E
MSLLTEYARLIKPATTFALAILMFVPTPCSRADNTPPLPLGVVLDNKGNPISFPTDNRSALEFSSPAVKETNRASSPAQPKKRKPHTKKLPHKQQLAGRAHIANDPSCRWLNNRMNKLEKSLTSTGNKSSNSYHKKELAIRNKEWNCMKCGAEGPKQKDYDRCQHRR